MSDSKTLETDNRPSSLGPECLKQQSLAKVEEWKELAKGAQMASHEELLTDANILQNSFKDTYSVSNELNKFISSLAQAADKIYKDRHELFPAELNLGLITVDGETCVYLAILFYDQMELDYLSVVPSRDFLVFITLTNSLTIGTISTISTRQFAQSLLNYVCGNSGSTHLPHKLLLLMREKPDDLVSQFQQCGKMELSVEDERRCDLVPDVEKCLKDCGREVLPLFERIWPFLFCKYRIVD
ncbi:hypothetical protein RRF57_000638 [Xylaria bambusicola]|uniref:Uncharacterized protein n=1 Tax=Xylaria bambusicola TaxID=326684 RepID=A0AAN7Z0V6_9PEZI